MAMKFGGFTPEQMGKIIPEMAGMQADEQAKFLAATPSAASRVGMMAEQASKRIGMAQGGYVQGYQIGGSVTTPTSDTQNNLTTAQQAYATAQKNAQAAMAASQKDPSNKTLANAAMVEQASINSAQANLASASAAYKVAEVPSASEVTKGMLDNPMSSTVKSEVATPSATDVQAGKVATGVGTVGTEIPQVDQTVAETAEAVDAPEVTPAVTYEAIEATADVSAVLDRLEAATGKPSAEALVDAQTMNPQQLAQLGISPAQIAEAQKVADVEARKLQEGELISGSTVDMDRVKAETNFQAATGAPSSDATVQGQLTGLMEDFEGKSPPAWAAGAMRNAASKMASRGLSASSMAGQAMIQAAMESALPIAVQDSQTSAKFELTNLSNKQQTAMFAAEKRADFLGLEFNQEFQSRVANSAKISEIANMNFTAEQQVALENARMAQTVDLTNLNAKNAKILADVAAMSQLDMTNLNNRQQSAVQNAKAFLDTDMANLANTQQTALMKNQQLTNALLTDQAAMNASKQFNASSENQTNQFFSNLGANIAMYNSEQANAMNKFNAGEANAIDQYNATQRTAREQFNATNALVVAQANASWSQSITTAETAAMNQSNRDAAMTANQFTVAAYNNVLQEERDMISYAYKIAESEAERVLRIQLQAMQNEVSMAEIQANIDVGRGKGLGSFLGAVAPGLINWASSGASGGL
tara:strand:+ start:90 stop:2201 length:2112 start_codon:yes stop_codon:yes gene_type:complete